MAGANTWYISRGGQRVGPMDSTQIKHMAQSGQLTPDDHVWREGMPDWVKASMIQGLFTRPAGRAAGAAGLAGGSTAVHQRPDLVDRLPAEPAIVPIVAGIFLLLTFAIPWFVGKSPRADEKTWIWSWSIVDKPDVTPVVADTSFATLLVAGWVIGLAAVIISPMLRGLPRALTLAGLGLAAFIFLLAAIGNGAMPLAFVQLWLTGKALAMLLLIFGAIMAVTCHLRVQGQINLLIRILQIVSAAAVVIVGLIAFITIFTAKPFELGGRSLWTFHTDLKPPFHVIGRILTMMSYIGILAAGIMALIHGAVPSIRDRSLSASAVWTLYFTVAATHFLRAGCLLAGFEKQGSTQTADWGKMLIITNLAVLLAGVLMLLVSGAVAAFGDLSRIAARVAAQREFRQPLATAARQPVATQPATMHAAAPIIAPLAAAPLATAPQAAAPATAGPAGDTIEQKFARLEQLRKANILTEDEYQEKRRKLISEI